MTLIEKMVAAYEDKLEPYTDASGFNKDAAMHAALAVVRAHYADPASWSDKALKAAADVWQHDEAWDEALAAAMKADADE